MSAAVLQRLESLDEYSMTLTPMPQSPTISASRPRSSTITSGNYSSTSQTPLHRRMSSAFRRVSKDLDRSKEKDLTRSSGNTKYIPPPPLEPLDPALAASRLAWNAHPSSESSGARYYDTIPVRGSGYNRYPTTRPTTLRVEEHKVKGFRAFWRDFILNLRMKLYRLRKHIFGRAN